MRRCPCRGWVAWRWTGRIGVATLDSALGTRSPVACVPKWPCLPSSGRKWVQAPSRLRQGDGRRQPGSEPVPIFWLATGTEPRGSGWSFTATGLGAGPHRLFLHLKVPPRSARALVHHAHRFGAPGPPGHGRASKEPSRSEGVLFTFTFAFRQSGSGHRAACGRGMGLAHRARSLSPSSVPSSESTPSLREGSCSLCSPVAHLNPGHGRARKSPRGARGYFQSGRAQGHAMKVLSVGHLRGLCAEKHERSGKDHKRSARTTSGRPAAPPWGPDHRPGAVGESVRPSQPVKPHGPERRAPSSASRRAEGAGWPDVAPIVSTGISQSSATFRSSHPGSESSACRPGAGAAPGR